TRTPTYTATSTNTPTLTPTPIPAICEPVVWMSGVYVAVSGNTIQKNLGAPSTWDAGAISTRAISSGDGYVFATVDATNTYRMFGLSVGDSGVHYSDIDFAAYLAGGTLMVYEGGSSKGSFGPIAVGDTI